MSIQLPFWKLESIGNDFPLLHSSDLSPELPLDQLSIRICDRRFGVGGDGLLTLAQDSPTSLTLRMFNPDGTEDFCGNGIRCAAHHAYRQQWVGHQFSIFHLGRRIEVEILEHTIRTQIGQASYQPTLVPLRPGTEELFNKEVYHDQKRSIVGSALTTGSTHVIVPVTVLPTDEEMKELGPLIEQFPLYPQRTSIIWRRIDSKDVLQIRIWERGVGETLGCGTGSSAAAMDYLKGEGRGGIVKVQNPGGSITVEADLWDKPITLEGKAREIYSGLFPL